MRLDQLLNNQNQSCFQDSAILVLSDGTEFTGKSIGFPGVSCGEVVFNTSMSGYQEIISDPSYSNQLVTLTCPHIGNVGCNKEDMESNTIYLSGLIVKNLSKFFSNHRSEESINDFLLRNKIVGISDIDTRKLTLHLRKNGSKNGVIFSYKEKKISEVREEALKILNSFKGILGSKLAMNTSTKIDYTFHKNEEKNSNIDKNKKPLIVVYDLGIKKNILKILDKFQCRLIVVPYNYKYVDVLSLNPDGIVLSNGPGDPEPCKEIIKIVKKIVKDKIPLLGICLGHQIFAIACGAKTKKMLFGHHGANHPIQNLTTGKIYITSQNHGFVVDESSVSSNLKVTHKSLFDGTIQGLSHEFAPAFSYQGHPEGSPGPNDLENIFSQFVLSLRK